MSPQSSQAESSSGLKFGVKVVGGKAGANPPADYSTITFNCPNCGKGFEESDKAAGKRTRCPKCATEFVIPGGTTMEAPPAPPMVAVEKQTRTEPPSEQSVDDKVAAALAAYEAAKKSPRKHRWITPTTIIPIGFFLLTLGGVASIVGSYYMTKGFMDSTSGIMGGSGSLSVDGGLLKPFADQQKLVRELADEAGGGRPRPNDPAKNILDQLPLDGLQGGANPQQTLAERKEKQESAQAKLIGGVIASSVGMFVTFIGGIFLLAGLIGRFLQPVEGPSQA